MLRDYIAVYLSIIFTTLNLSKQQALALTMAGITTFSWGYYYMFPEKFESINIALFGQNYENNLINKHYHRYNNLNVDIPGLLEMAYER